MPIKIDHFPGSKSSHIKFRRIGITYISNHNAIMLEHINDSNYKNLEKTIQLDIKNRLLNCSLVQKELKWKWEKSWT